MVVCPRCGGSVDNLDAIPAEVITKEMVESVDEHDIPLDLEACTNFIGDLMDK